MVRQIESMPDVANSIPALKGGGLPESNSSQENVFPPPITITKLQCDKQVTWLWQGYLIPGCVMLLTGLWKTGRTTLITWLLRALDNGGTLATTVTPGRVLVVSEEHAHIWTIRRDAIGIGDHVDLILRSFNTHPNWRVWEEFTRYVARLVEERGYLLVIFDTWASVNPTWDENDTASTVRALTPLYKITGAGASVLLSHHPRKGDATERQAARGSGALPGFVDVIVELRRFDAWRREDRRRVLTGYSRFAETPTEVVVELTDTGFKTIGTKSDATIGGRVVVWDSETRILGLAVWHLLRWTPFGVQEGSLLRKRCLPNRIRISVARNKRLPKAG